MEEKKRSAGSRKAVLVATLGLACGAAAVMLVAARRPMPSVDMSSVTAALAEATADTPAAAPAATETAASISAASAASVADIAAPAPAKIPTPRKPAAKAPVAAASAVAKPAFEEPVATTHQALAVVPAAREEAPAPVVEVQTASVTINGCLERDGNMFRLRDVDGQDAPKSRSWKSGFLRKGKPKIDIVDATNNRLKLTDHVGHRVTITGSLEDKEMQARTITRVAPYCE